jgi:PPM family protein phosphatase
VDELGPTQPRGLPPDPVASTALWMAAERARESARPDRLFDDPLAERLAGPDTATVALHAGDSRLYRLRDGRLEQLTHDHTLVAELMRAGEISQAQAQTHPHRYLLTRAVGVGPDIDVDYAGVSCRPGDRLLLCTDGLFKALSADEMKAVLASPAKPQESADELVTRAVERRTEDNVTAMVIDVQ